MRTSNILDESTRSSLFGSNYYKRTPHASSEFTRKSWNGNDQPIKTFINLEIITTAKKPPSVPKKNKSNARFQQYFTYMKEKIKVSPINTNIDAPDIAEEIPDKHSPKIFQISPTSLKITPKIKCPNSDRNKNPFKHFDFNCLAEANDNTEKSPSNIVIREENQLRQN
jgi:hypothetical protein